MDTKFLQSFQTRCSETNEEFDRRVADRQAELKAVIDAIGILNSDTSFDTFDKTVSTDFLQMSPLAGEQALRLRALSVLRDEMNKAVGDPVVQVVHVPQLQIVEKNAEAPQTQTIQGTQTSESLGSAHVRQVAQAETVKVDKIGSGYSTCSSGVTGGSRRGAPHSVVKPGTPDAKIKFLVKEVPHGVGGFVPTRTETVLQMNWVDGTA